ncbi:ROK family protein [Glutamicibacter sp. FBE19]|uniref:ROK family transcriptional regulator n=1 Tax=Glutamicibacter sp. FBE19 TaxID=2761534 RepID=UPI00189648C7|nr:ROK family protein [Glutamicibacter sp. FBE19]MBF6673173.1 ROK family protein [Glutamicibacter sp. FBE19]
MSNVLPPSPAQSSRVLVLDRVRAEGPVSRVELAGHTGLTQASISNLVKTLLAEGLLVETGERTYTGAKGKPRVLLGLNPQARYSIGVQLGADWIVMVLTDAAGTVMARTRMRGARSTAPVRVVSAVATQIEALLALSGVDRQLVAGIGLAVPGIIDLQTGAILSSASLPLWELFAVREALQKATGLLTLVDNVATAAVMGDYWSGAIPEASAHCTLYMGASINTGLLIDGTVYRGASSNTGLLGRASFERAAGERATVEEVAGPRAVAVRARQELAAGRQTIAVLDDPANPFADFAAIASAAVHGDSLALELIEESAQHIATVVVAMVNILDLDSVTLAGPSLSTAGSLYLTQIRDRISAEALSAPKHDVTVRLSAQVTDAASVGAAALMLQHSLAKPAG